VSRRSAAAARLAAVSALAVAGALVPATSASAAPLSVEDQSARDRLAIRSHASRLGNDLAGYVIDLETGARVWGSHGKERQIPASTVKILTAVSALQAFGPEHRFTTRVVAGATADQVVLVGGGDPMLTRKNVRKLAKATVAAATAQGLTSIRVRVDDSLFPAPTLAPGWSSGYLVRDVSPVRALVVDQHRRWDTSIDAGRVFKEMVEKRGVDVRTVRRRLAPEGTVELATVQGPRLADQVAYMLRTSDNDVAEMLHRMVAVQTGHGPTWEGAAQALVDVLAGLGVTLTPGSVVDGSGLSRADRLRPREVVAALRAVFDPANPNLASLQQGALAVAGVSGTLAPAYRRYVSGPTRCAAGLIEAKTGSLRGVIALSGFARGADGSIKLFSFLLNRVPSTLTTRRAVDRLATTVTGCW
jgi:D-alanyl-D-alanine carboxypeptidase/D-alanyl-D-alanine-endopeptidase (penicillin-binding protein 4)